MEKLSNHNVVPPSMKREQFCSNNKDFRTAENIIGTIGASPGLQASEASNLFQKFNQEDGRYYKGQSRIDRRATQLRPSKDYHELDELLRIISILRDTPTEAVKCLQGQDFSLEGITKEQNVVNDLLLLTYKKIANNYLESKRSLALTPEGIVSNYLEGKRSLDDVIVWTLFQIEDSKSIISKEELYKNVFSNLKPNDISYKGLIKLYIVMIESYINIKELEKAQHIYKLIPKDSLDINVHNAMINAYGNFGKLKEARKIYDFLPKYLKNIETYNIMISMYINVGDLEEAKKVYGSLPKYFRGKVNDNIKVGLGTQDRELTLTEESYCQIIEDSKEYYFGSMKDDKREGDGKAYLTKERTTYNGFWEKDKQEGYGIFVKAGGEVYQGNFKNGKKDGYGVLIEANGNIYEGDFEGGKKNGFGTYKYSDGDIYEGSFKNNQKNGFGRHKYANGSIYEGDFEGGKKNGFGTFKYLSGEIYQGDFKDGLRKGKGKLICSKVNITNSSEPNFSECEGDWDNDQLNGMAIFIDKEKIYVGSVKKSRQHGIGYLSFSDGSVFIGAFNKNKKNGFGICKDANGDVYQGNYNGGNVFQGKGKLTKADGNIYIGHLKGGVIEGAGEAILSDKSKFNGNFIGGKRNGPGKLQFANGDIYQGNFENDVQVGEGKLTQADGSEYEGIWVNGELRGLAKLTYTNGNSLLGEFDGNNFKGNVRVTNSNNEVSTVILDGLTVKEVLSFQYGKNCSILERGKFNFDKNLGGSKPFHPTLVIGIRENTEEGTKSIGLFYSERRGKPLVRRAGLIESEGKKKFKEGIGPRGRSITFLESSKADQLSLGEVKVRRNSANCIGKGKDFNDNKGRHGNHISPKADLTTYEHMKSYLEAIKQNKVNADTAMNSITKKYFFKDGGSFKGGIIEGNKGFRLCYEFLSGAILKIEATQNNIYSKAFFVPCNSQKIMLDGFPDKDGLPEGRINIKGDLWFNGSINNNKAKGLIFMVTMKKISPICEYEGKITKKSNLEKGILTWPNGATYEGDIINGMPKGSNEILTAPTSEMAIKVNSAAVSLYKEALLIPAGKFDEAIKKIDEAIATATKAKILFDIKEKDKDETENKKNQISCLLNIITFYIQKSECIKIYKERSEDLKIAQNLVNTLKSQLESIIQNEYEFINEKPTDEKSIEGKFINEKPTHKKSLTEKLKKLQGKEITNKEPTGEKFIKENSANKKFVDEKLKKLQEKQQVIDVLFAQINNPKKFKQKIPYWGDAYFYGVNLGPNYVMGEIIDGESKKVVAIYTGDYIKQQFNGVAKLDYVSLGEYYEGEVEHGAPHGKGTHYASKDVVYYKGEFKDGLANGEGKFNFGEVSYEGDAAGGKANGQGTLYRLDGTVFYRGDYKENCPCGKGTIYKRDGTKMEVEMYKEMLKEINTDIWKVKIESLDDFFQGILGSPEVPAGPDNAKTYSLHNLNLDQLLRGLFVDSIKIKNFSGSKLKRDISNPSYDLANKVLIYRDNGDKSNNSNNIKSLISIAQRKLGV